MPDAPDDIALSPHGRLTFPDTGSTLHEAFRQNESAAFIQPAGKRRLESVDAPVPGYWRGIAGELLRGICHLPEGSGGEVKVPDPDASRLSQWVLNAPPMRGGEYLTPEVPCPQQLHPSRTTQAARVRFVLIRNRSRGATNRGTAKGIY